MPNLAAAAARRQAGGIKKYKGKYIGPDKYKGKIPSHLKHKYKGEYFGKEKYGGLVPKATKMRRKPKPEASTPWKDMAPDFSNRVDKTPNKPNPGHSRPMETRILQPGQYGTADKINITPGTQFRPTPPKPANKRMILTPSNRYTAK